MSKDNLYQPKETSINQKRPLLIKQDLERDVLTIKTILSNLMHTKRTSKDNLHQSKETFILNKRTHSSHDSFMCLATYAMTPLRQHAT